MTEWFVRNAREARWIENELGAFCSFEDDVKFPELGINLNVLRPGQPMCMYHREAYQEDFLVLRGECLLIVEGRSEEHTSELQSHSDLVCRLLLEKKNLS